MPATATLRARGSSDAGLSTTVVIGIVCGAVGGLVLLLFVARAVMRLRLFRPKPAPLPAVQPLAHRRASRAPGEWLEPVSYARGTRHYQPSDSGSAVSLVRPGTASLVSQSASQSQSGWDEPAYDDGSLPTPRRPFLEHRASSSASSEGSSSVPPSPRSGSAVHYQIPLSGSSSSTSHERVPRRQSRTPSTHSAGTSRSRSRGAPHSRRNTMHIVLPAPLAPQLAAWSPSPEATPSPATAGSLRERRMSGTEPPAVDSWIHRRVRSSTSRERMGSSASRHRSSSRRAKASSVAGHPSSADADTIPEIPAYLPSADSGFDPLGEETVRGRR